jgi:phage FluMu protein Com
MIKEIRCPRCNKRLFDVTEKTIGPVTSQCRCKAKVLVMFYSLNKIIYKTK